MKKLCFWILLSGFLLGFSLDGTPTWTEGAFASDPELGMPSADFDVDPDILVPIGIVKKIALAKAQELWGTVSPGEPIPCCDEEGRIDTYMCPFCIDGPFPSYGQIMDEVRTGRAMVEEVQKSSIEATPDDTGGGTTDEKAGVGRVAGGERDATAEIGGGSASRAALTGGSMTRQYSPSAVIDYQAEYKEARSQELGIGRYGTVYVSARYDRYPIPLVSHYLAPYYTTGDLAKTKAEQKMSRAVTLDRYYFLGYHGQFYEFDSDGEKVTIHAQSLEPQDLPAPVRLVPTPSQLEEVEQVWQEVLGTP